MGAIITMGIMILVSVFIKISFFQVFTVSMMIRGQLRKYHLFKYIFTLLEKKRAGLMYFENLVKKFLHCLISLQRFFFFFLTNFL